MTLFQFKQKPAPVAKLTEEEIREQRKEAELARRREQKEQYEKIKADHEVNTLREQYISGKIEIAEFDKLLGYALRRAE